METRIILIALMALIKTTSSANILAILPSPVLSHRNAFKAVLKALVDEHKITYYGPKININHSNITERDINIYNYLNDVSDSVFKHTCKKSSFEVVINDILWMNYTFYEDMFKGTDIKKLLKKTEKYDLVISIAHTAEIFFKLAHLYDIPIVQVATSIAFPWSNEYIGNPNFYASDMSFITPETSKNVIDRLIKYTKTTLVISHYKWRYLPMLNKISQQYFPPGTPSIEEVTKQRTSLLLVNSQSSMGYTRANVPGVIETGGLHCSPAKPLPEDLENFMDSSGDDGVIYFSLGSTLRGSSLPENIRRGILNVFKKLPQKVLWKWEGNMTDLPPNVITSKWIPQQDVLGHQKLKLFITQGGMLSTQEAAYHGVPMVMIPIMLDQYTNAIVVEQNGYGLKISFCDFTEEEFFDKIQKVLRDPMYAHKAKEISSAVKDMEMTPSEKVKWWISYILRHKDVSLRPINSSWLQYSELDIYLIISFMIVFIIFCCGVIICFVRNLLKSSTNKKLKKL